MEIDMTDKSKTPPAKKTIQDPPEYAAVNKLKGHENQAGYQQNGQSAVTPGQARVSVTGFGEGSEAAGRIGTGNIAGEAETPASDDPKSKKVGGRQQGARNPQTGERIARNPQTGE
jgi:hypothetical protein